MTQAYKCHRTPVPRAGFYEPETLYQLFGDPLDVLALAVILSAADDRNEWGQVVLDELFLESQWFAQLCGQLELRPARMRQLVRRLYERRREALGRGRYGRRRTKEGRKKDGRTEGGRRDNIYPPGFLKEAQEEGADGLNVPDRIRGQLVRVD